MRLFKRILLIIPFIFLVLSCSDDEDVPEKFILSVTINPEDGGSVSPDGGVFEDGTVVTLTATPAEGYVFKEWMGGLISTDNPVSVSMDSDMNVTLVFVQYDGDNDGVSDDVDECLNTPEGEQVDENGCSSSQTDADGDGITDDIDVCPDTPEGEDANEEGCSASQLDTDGDGVFDDEDICPNTPEGVEVDVQGCPLTSPIYLDVNGITIKSYEWAQAGQTGQINGVVYTIVNETMLREMVSNGADVTKVCTSMVTDMSQLFYGSTNFNEDIGSWDVSKVTTMEGMFWNPIGIGGFTTPNPFNQDISYWDVSNVTDMNRMFAGTLFNQDISNWDVSGVTTMVAMFSISIFDQPIGNWDVSSVVDMKVMFNNSQFNQPIGNWDVSNVTDMNNMFYYSHFNQPIGNWDVGNVTDMSYMFSYSSFNQDIGGWDVSKVTSMEGMFNSLDLYVNVDPNPFNQDISSWDVSSVMDMSFMFGHSSFNQDLSSWDVENVTVCHSFNMNSFEWTLPKPNFTNCNPDY